MGMGYAYVRPEGNPRRKLHYVRSREVIIEKEEKSQ
jgi:hypothetical protein